MRRRCAALTHAATAVSTCLAPTHTKINSTQASNQQQEAALRNAPLPLRSRMLAGSPASSPQHPTQSQHSNQPLLSTTRPQYGPNSMPARQFNSGYQRQDSHNHQPQHAADSGHMRACGRLADLRVPPSGVTPPSGVRALFGGEQATLGPLSAHSMPLRATPGCSLSPHANLSHYCHALTPDARSDTKGVGRTDAPFAMPVAVFRERDAAGIRGATARRDYRIGWRRGLVPGSGIPDLTSRKRIT